MSRRARQIIHGDLMATPTAEPRAWAKAHGTYIAGRAYLDEADKMAADMETKWGCGRLRLLVAPDLREKFDRQRYLLNQAIWHGQLEDVRVQSGRMVNAWKALDAAAEASGAAKLDLRIMEVVLDNGCVAAIVPDNDHARLVRAEDRRMDVWTLEEVGRVLSAFPTIGKIKESFPGAEVVRCKRSIDDPMDSIHDTDEELGDAF